MTVQAVVYNSSNTGAAIAATDVIDGSGYTRGLLDAATADPLNSDTEIKIKIHRSHPAAAQFQKHRVVRIMDGAREDAKFVVRKIEDQIVDGDEAGETITVSGRTLIGDFREVLLRNVSAVPSDTVSYNFAHPTLDDSGWSDSVYQVDRSAIGGWSWPPGWYDPFTQGVWASSHSVGSIFGRTTKTLVAGQYVGQIAADSGFRFYVDGVKTVDARSSPQDRAPFWWSPYRAFLLDLPAGSHTFAVEGVKQAGGTNRGTVWFGIWPVANYRLGGNPITLSGESSSANPVYAGWKWTTYPGTRPAPPCTRIIHEQVSRAQTDGALTGWTLGFSATHDSNGTPAPAHEWGMSTSRTIFDAIQSIATAGWLTFRVREGAGKVLDAFVTYGSQSGESYTADDMLSMRRVVEA